MICPKCGFEIPEGHMYCDNCGAEINFVPDFEPEVENEINATLSGVADELNKEERIKQERKQKRMELIKSIKNKRHVILMSVAAIVVFGFCVYLIALYPEKTSNNYLTSAELAKNEGDIEKAISILQEAEEQFPDNSDLLFRLSDYYLENGDTEKAVEALLDITENSNFQEETIVNAYESIISIYKQNNESDKIVEILQEGENSIVAGLREKYIPESPILLPVSGEYDDTVSIVLEPPSGADFNIYYTVNDGNPDAGSILYENEIVIDTVGEYEIKAVCINEYGVSSSVVEGKFSVVEGAPAPPEILEPSGEYNQNTMIVAVAEAGSTIFYTSNGADPTSNSKQYISPITMPVGTSHFKFVAINEEGVMSEVVERNYHLVFTRLVSTEQAVNLLVNTLVRLDYLLDSSGKVRGVDGYNQYIYNSEIEIQGAGEYYVIVEYHVTNDGISTPTGLLYAVNTHDGSVNRLGYDSSGKYTLITISNR